MIGRLLQSAASTFSQHSSSRPQTPLESVTEEAHTRDLLYPETATLRSLHHNGLTLHNGRLPNAREAANYDDRGGLDVTFPGDIRIMIAQDANSRYHQPQVLYDSKPPTNLHTSRSGSPLGPVHERDSTSPQGGGSGRGNAGLSPASSSSRRHHTPHSSIFQSYQTQPLTPNSPRSSDSRGPRSTLGDSRSRASPFQPLITEPETTQGKLAREAKEETEALLGSMFGAPGFRIDTGTKLHIIPRKSAEDLSNARSPKTPRPVSAGGFSRLPTPLMRSTSATESSLTDHVTTDSSERRISSLSRPTIMFTRLFSVQLLESASPELEAETRSSEDKKSLGGLSNAWNDEDETRGKRSGKNVKQKKVPMYAISMLLHLPMDSSHARVRTPVPHHGTSSLGSSYNDCTLGTSWHPENSAFARYMDLRFNGVLLGADNLLNIHISNVLAHWNIISKSLELLETAARFKLHALLEQSVPLAPLMSAPPSKAGIPKPKKAKQPSQQSIHVQPDCLQSCTMVTKEADFAGQRIINGLRTRRVIAGQGRWGAWREEARWVGRWAGGRDQNFFFFNLLTAFLGCHTVWLESIGPSWHRRRHAMQQSQQSHDVRLHERTVIVSTDKMAARRLIFLLAAFLPGQHNAASSSLQMASQSPLVYSESPPSIHAAREQSLRRVQNTKANGYRKVGANSHGHGRSVSFSLKEVEVNDDQRSNATTEHITRRMSDTRSLRSESLAIPSVGESRKTPTSTSIVMADSTTPVPHFSELSFRPSSGPTSAPRRGSSGSLASLALTHTLKRSESTGLSTSGSGGRWGSVVSGFWSTRRGSSTDESDAIASSQEGIPNIRTIKEARETTAQGKLNRMVEEAATSTLVEEPTTNGTLTQNLPKPLLIEDCLKQNQKEREEGTSGARSIPQKRKIERAPLKMSYNEDDGYVDIEMPPSHSFASSLASSFNSLRQPATTNSSFHEHCSPYGVPTNPDTSRAKPEPMIDVAGWLKKYHPDFTLQAVNPYDTLIDEVKRSMRAESSLDLALDTNGYSSTPDGEWTDVCTTLIAETTTFSIQRLRLRRRKRPSGIPSTPTSTKSTKAPPSPASPFPSSELFEHSFIEEPVMDMDATFIDAVERVLAQSGPSSRAPSPSRGAPVSRPASVRNVRLEGMGLLEVPHSECRKMVLGALEEVVRSVWSEGHRGDGDVDKKGAISRKGSGEERGRAGTREMPDSTLREGVRRWLAGVEDAC